MSIWDDVTSFDIRAGELKVELDVSIPEGKSGTIEELILPSYRAFMRARGECSRISYPLVNGKISEISTFHFRTHEDLRAYVDSLDAVAKKQVVLKY